MKSLINVTKTKDERLKLASLVELFSQKIKDSITNDRDIIVSTENSCMSVLNRIAIEDYECDMEHLYLNDGSFELHMKMDEIKDIKYDNTYDESFTFLHNDSTEIHCCFL